MELCVIVCDVPSAKYVLSGDVYMLQTGFTGSTCEKNSNVDDEKTRKVEHSCVKGMC